MNHDIGFQCPDLSSSWSPETQRLPGPLQWNILWLLNSINTLQCSVQAGALGHFQRVAGLLPVRLAILLPVTITSTQYREALTASASFVTHWTEERDVFQTHNKSMQNEYCICCPKMWKCCLLSHCYLENPNSWGEKQLGMHCLKDTLFNLSQRPIADRQVFN